MKKILKIAGIILGVLLLLIGIGAMVIHPACAPYSVARQHF